MSAQPKSRKKWWLLVPAVLLLLYGALQLVQTVGVHGGHQFRPDYPRQDLTPLLCQEALDREDYTTLFLQTGLAPAAIDALLDRGDADQILRTQAGFFEAPDAACIPLLPARFTCEDRILDEEGRWLQAVELCPLEPGDLILTFGTHSVGWRHGHGGLVVETDPAVTLEATVLGSDSARVKARHWPTYANFLVLRVRDADDATRQQVAETALVTLDGVPYSLFAGLLGPKAPALEAEDHPAHCAYLPWYAWQSCGVDLDSDGGRIVTIYDLAASPLLEVVQVCGVDPRTLLELGRVTLPE